MICEQNEIKNEMLELKQKYNDLMKKQRKNYMKEYMGKYNLNRKKFYCEKCDKYYINLDIHLVSKKHLNL